MGLPSARGERKPGREGRAPGELGKGRIALIADRVGEGHAVALIDAAGGDTALAAGLLAVAAAPAAIEASQDLVAAAAEDRA